MPENVSATRELPRRRSPRISLQAKLLALVLVCVGLPLVLSGFFFLESQHRLLSQRGHEVLSNGVYRKAAAVEQWARQRQEEAQRWAASFVVSRKFLPAAIVLSLLVAVGLALGYPPALRMQSRQPNLAAITAILMIVLGYVWFVLFISGEGVRALRLHTEMRLAQRIQSLDRRVARGRGLAHDPRQMLGHLRGRRVARHRLGEIDQRPVGGKLPPLDPAVHLRNRRRIDGGQQRIGTDGHGPTLIPEPWRLVIDLAEDCDQM